MFHTQINGSFVVFSEKQTFKAHIDFRGSVPLRMSVHGIFCDPTYLICMFILRPCIDVKENWNNHGQLASNDIVGDTDIGNLLLKINGHISYFWALRRL